MGEYTKHGYKLDQTGQQTQDILDAVNNKVDKVEGKGLSTNDYTTEEKTKLEGIAAGAEVNVQGDWGQNDSTADDYIKNRTHHIEWSRAIYVDVTNTGNPDGTLANMTFEVKAAPTVYFDYIGDVEGKKTYRRPRVKVGNIISYLQVEIYESGSSIIATLYFSGSSAGTNTLSETLDTGFSLSSLGDEVLVEEYYKLNNKFLDLDEVPTSGSDKPVTSGGVYTAVSAKYTKPATGIPAADLAEGVIPDVSNFITKSVNDLTYYYLKTETYSQTEINNLIGAIQQFHYEIAASTSAVTDPQPNVLYLIGPTGSGADKYEEYVYANSTWTKIGDTSVDLSGYVTTTALNTALADYTTTANLNTLLAGKQDTIDSTHKLDYSLLSNTPTIPAAPGTLDTNNTAAQSVNSSEALSGVVKLHKVAKTGSYNNLNNKPTIPTISTNIEADKTSDTKTASPKAVYDAIQANTEPDLTPVVDSDAVFVQRAVTPASGVGRIQKLKGKTLVWNQLFNKGRAQGAFTWTDGGGKCVFTDGTYSSTTIYITQGTRDFGTPIIGHKYFFRVKKTAGTVTSGRVSFYTYHWSTGAPRLDMEPGSTSDEAKGIINPAQADAYFIGSYADNTVTSGLVFYVTLIDLTQMFGSGNEPSTVAEFEALYPLPYYNNNAGTLINNGATGFKTLDANDTQVDSVPLNLTTITGKLNGEGSSVTIFPEGLKSAGTVYDEIVGNKAIKRIGVVDMGDIPGGWQGSQNTRYTASLIGLKVAPSNLTEVGMLSEKYTYVVSSAVASNDKVISSNNGVTQGQIMLRDTSIATVNNIPAAITGVLLYYELATPEEYVLDTPLDLTFDTGTTEERLPADTASSVMAPFRADIQYGLTTREIMDEVEGEIPDVSGKEDKSNKVISLSSSSTDTEYPSAKCVYDIIGDVETLLAAL